MASKSSRPLGQESSQPALSAGEEDGNVDDLGDDDDVDDHTVCGDDGALTPLVTK